MRRLRTGARGAHPHDGQHHPYDHPADHPPTTASVATPPAEPPAPPRVVSAPAQTAGDHTANHGAPPADRGTGHDATTTAPPVATAATTATAVPPAPNVPAFVDATCSGDVLTVQGQMTSAQPGVTVQLLIENDAFLVTAETDAAGDFDWTGTGPACAPDQTSSSACSARSPPRPRPVRLGLLRIVGDRRTAVAHPTASLPQPGLALRSTCERGPRGRFAL